MKKILVLGGTHFVGRQVVERLLTRTDVSVTLFNRQRTNPELFSEVRRIVGNRETDDALAILAEDWDCVIDFSAYFPSSLDRLLQGLKDRVSRYIFISTLSVIPFDGTQASPINESVVIYGCTEDEKIDTSMNSYGQRKAECERILLNNSWLDSLILRPSIIYGRYDWTDRFYHWMYLMHNNKDIILPDEGNDLLSLTYSEDLADIIVSAIDVRQHRSVYNATTHEPLHLKACVELMRKCLNSESKVHMVDAQKLLDANVQPGTDIPMWFGLSIAMSNERLKQDFNYRGRTFERSIEECVLECQKRDWSPSSAGMTFQKLDATLEKLSLR